VVFFRHAADVLYRIVLEGRLVLRDKHYLHPLGRAPLRPRAFSEGIQPILKRRTPWP
jgi:hypothetical protein